MNKTVDEEKCILLENAKRDIQIYKMNCELELKESKITTRQSNDYKKYKYKCYYKINIFREDEDFKKENYVEIGGNGIELGDNSFILFKKLAKELKKNMEGWVEIEKYIGEIDLSFTGRHQLIERLRNSLTKIKFLDKDSVKELIENKKGGLYRISTHPDFITYNKEKLLSHKDHQVKSLLKNCLKMD